MTQSETRRLDQILLEKGLISEAHIRQALRRQKIEGGRLGSQLLFHRYIDEAGLVEALGAQLGCEGVVISKEEIPRGVIKMIPEKLAITHKIMPFEYKRGLNTLKIACENPRDNDLKDQLRYIVPDKKIKLYVAAELALNAVITKYYLGRDTTLDDHLIIDLPADERASSVGSPKRTGKQQHPRPAVLLVTDQTRTTEALRSLLSEDSCRVVVAETVDQAYKLIVRQNFHTMFIPEPPPDAQKNICDRARRLARQTIVRFYATLSDLLLGGDRPSVGAEALLKGLELLTSLLAGRTGVSDDRQSRVVYYTERLCRKLGLPEDDRLVICNAAYVYDLARFNHDHDESIDDRLLIQRTAELLAALDYPSLVVKMLRAMYREMTNEDDENLPREILGGNILTMAHLLSGYLPREDQLSTGGMGNIKEKLREHTGSLLLPEVVQGCIEMVHEEILNWHTGGTAGQVMIYTAEKPFCKPLTTQLQSKGFRTVVQHDLASFIELYHRGKPHLIVLVIDGPTDKIIEQIQRLTTGGVDLNSTPTFLWTDNQAIIELPDLGVRHVVLADGGLDLLLQEIEKWQARSITPWSITTNDTAPTSGARGQLAEMNLIDLLQALGPSRKTVQIDMHQIDPGNTSLTLYLDQGQISFAKCGELTGPTAVYEGLTWPDGDWTVVSIDPEELPPPNNQLPNESILMEGCRLMDETTRSKPPITV